MLINGVSGQPNQYNDFGTEETIDIEMANAMASGLDSIIVYNGASSQDILDSMSVNTSVKQLSASWIGWVNSSCYPYFEKFAVQGQTFLTSSGDWDAWWAPGSKYPYPPTGDSLVTIVGGTDLSTNGAGGPWSSETVWNSPDSTGSGGGVISSWSIPSYQQGIDMSQNGGSTSNRNGPDVAMVATNIYLVYHNGSWVIGGGTSYSTPLWASFMAMVNQQADSLGNSPAGYVNPAIYTIGKSASYNSAFHDITTGNNRIAPSALGYDAVSGYDLCTGWGSPPGQELINLLSNPLWSGNITLTSSYTVPSGQTLTILSGTTIKLGQNVGITVDPGAQIIAEGTQANPIRFERANSGQKWGQLYLKGSGNQFTWCLFDGGYKNVEILSLDNTFSNCTFRNGWRGISSGANQAGGGGRSYFKLTNCMIEDNSTVGVVVYHADAGFAHTTIQHNASAGLWLYDSPAHDFFETAIIDNATDNSSRDGVEVVGGSDVILFTYNGVNYGSGQNRIANNPGDQVLNDYSSTLNLGIPNTPDYGFNGIFGGSGYRVNNQNSSTVSAGEDWWGTSSPSSSLFNGPVDYSYYLTFDPSIYAGVGSNSYPHQMAPSSVSEPVLVQKKTSKASSETSGVKKLPLQQRLLPARRNKSGRSEESGRTPYGARLPGPRTPEVR